MHEKQTIDVPIENNYIIHLPKNILDIFSPTVIINYIVYELYTNFEFVDIIEANTLIINILLYLVSFF